ncbi:outer membrane lipoprotein-sorting protein [Pleionea sp. CnH1-48]|uniref:outer membrane lipoprotein-sorting protein n=1 Tax=Pleionea sp. CnH1-48 TaxID=2954494 RepID=UPI002097BE41|nr:outer membrane lipoprotein-sorting protein [Pleionea sp. CnH1-48]MCO7224335.1 outer membrane lipoprotein-sorting protein [Pleionea sp. CnH1-48]
MSNLVKLCAIASLCSFIELGNAESNQPQTALSESVKTDSDISTDLSVEERLKRADSYRFSLSPTKTVTYVHEYEQEKLEKTQVYEVFTKPGKGSLAVFKSASQAGQKVLMQDEKFWVFMPRTRRPIRISPMQKLLGDAAVGDLTTLSWSESYNATLAMPSNEEMLNKSDEISMLLEAKVKGVSYQKIELVVDASTSFPLRAKFYLKSGKLAKVAQFVRGELNEQAWVTEMVLENSVVASKKTIMQTVSAEVVDIPDKLFNPSFLIRNNLKSL